MRYGIFGGTFNPPHIGHVHAAKAAAAALGLKIIVIPDNIPPHKELPKGSASAEDRLAMARLMAEDIPGAVVSDIEIKRGRQSYTADTIAQLREKYPEDELWLIVGTDMLCSLENWYHPERILSEAGVAALARDAGDRERIEKSAEDLRRRFDARIELIDVPALPVSSSQVRETLFSGGERWLPERVFEYIREKGLYRHEGA